MKTEFTITSPTHTITTTLDPQRGGWFSVCSCGWQEPRPCWYKKRSLGRAAAHLEAPS